MNRVEESRILPFLWMKGESNTIIAEELDQIEACGIREICLESRPHPDFCGPLWWENLDFIMAEAKKRDMGIWILDDDRFPTGHCNGGFIKHPEHKKRYLAERHMDVIGPCQNAAVLIEPLIRPDGRLLAVLACPKPDGETLDVCAEGILDLTDQVENGFVYFDIPEGPYRLFVLYTTQTGGGRADYMNLIDADSVRVLIDEVYEPHYRRYREYAGDTFRGFFSDEPELGNEPGYPFDAALGKANVRLPWSAQMEDALRELWGNDFKQHLPALWYGMGEKTPALRYAYMDVLTRLVHTCFSGQLMQWCDERNLEYIGHIIEDDNAHARMGCSIGHYFREMKGQHMAGIDVVHHEIMPGFTERIHQWVAADSDGEFFHYGLAKLGSSCAHIDPVKRNRALCEIFGNYGWGEGVSLMRWLTNHMLVRGINVFTPHAFAMQYPEADCPPHFYARGNNPQFPAFIWLMHYMNRAANLLQGVHMAEAAVLYHAEAEWSGGRYMLFQKPVRELMEHQLDCDVIPADIFAENHCLVKDGKLVIHEESYSCLIVPYSQYLVREAITFIMEAAANGLPVFIIDGLPDADTKQQPLPEGFAAAVQVVKLHDLAGAVTDAARPQLTCTCADAGLRFFGVKRGEDKVYMFFNENIAKAVETTVTFHGESYASIQQVDPWADTQNCCCLTDNTMNLHLEPGEARFYILQKDQCETSEKRLVGTERLEADWHVSGTDESGEVIFEDLWIRAGEPLPNMNGPRMNPEFTGTYRYRAVTTVKKQDMTCQLLLPEAGDSAEVILNGVSLGQMAGFPARVDITDALLDGDNEWIIKVTTTLVWKRKDGVSTFMQLAPTGMTKTPVLEWYS